MIEAVDPTTLIVGSSMAIMGNITHILKKIIEERTSGNLETVKTYIKKYPYRIVLGIIGSAVGMGILYEMNQITVLGSFAAGYMADSGLGILSTRAKAKLL